MSALQEEHYGYGYPERYFKEERRRALRLKKQLRRAKTAQHLKMFTSLCLIIGILSTFIGLTLYVTVIEAQQVNTLNQEVYNLTNENNLLKYDISRAASPSRLTKEAAKFELVPPEGYLKINYTTSLAPVSTSLSAPPTPGLTAQEEMMKEMKAIGQKLLQGVKALGQQFTYLR